VPKYATLKPFDAGQEWKKQTIHFNKDEWDKILSIARTLGYDDLSSVIKESLNLANLHLQLRDRKITEVKDTIKLFNLKECHLF
jgi:predicted nucleic acid-binding OB-fold protein